MSDFDFHAEDDADASRPPPPPAAEPLIIEMPVHTAAGEYIQDLRYEERRDRLASSASMFQRDEVSFPMRAQSY